MTQQKKINMKISAGANGGPMFRVVCSDSACHEENLMYNGQTASVSNARYNNTLFQSGRFILFYFPGQLLIVRLIVITPGVATGPGCQASVS